MSPVSTPTPDKRPFKGKGAIEWLERSEREYKKIVAEMEALADESKSLPGKHWYVFLHYRKAIGQRFLMWRAYGGSGSHLTWEAIEPVVLLMKQEPREWYEAFDERIRLLNAKESAARGAVRVARSLLMGNKWR